MFRISLRFITLKSHFYCLISIFEIGYQFTFCHITANYSLPFFNCHEITSNKKSRVSCSPFANICRRCNVSSTVRSYQDETLHDVNKIHGKMPMQINLKLARAKRHQMKIKAKSKPILFSIVFVSTLFIIYTMC